MSRINGMDLEARLRVKRMLDTPQHLSIRIVPRHEFSLKHHHLKNNLNYLAFDFKKNDMFVHVK